MAYVSFWQFGVFLSTIIALLEMAQSSISQRTGRKQGQKQNKAPI